MEEFKPGQVISPQGDTTVNDPQPVAPPSPSPAAPQPERPAEQTPPAPAPTQNTAPPAQAAVVQDTPAADSGWQFRQETASVPVDMEEQHMTNPDDEISWTAAEFIAHDKSFGWYALLALAGVVGVALVYWVTKDKITAGIIAFGALAFGLFAARKPKVQTYAVDHTGVHIGGRTYGLTDYKSFSIAEEGAQASIVFMPLKRFMPPLTVYLSSDVEDRVVDFLAQVLPFEQHRQDAVDSLMKRIRF